MTTVAQAKTKARIVEKSAPIEYNPKWVNAKKGVLKLSEEKLWLKDWEIPLSAITSATLIEFYSFWEKSYILSVETTENIAYQFGLKLHPIWKKQTVLPLKLQGQNIRYSPAGFLLRLFLVILTSLAFILAWFLILFSSLQQIMVSRGLVALWLILAAIVIGFDAIWAKVSTQRRISYAYGSFITVPFYTLAGFMAMKLFGVGTVLLVGGLTGLIVMAIEAILGGFIAYRLGAYDEVMSLTPFSSIIFSTLFTPIFGFLIGLIGARFAV